MTDEELVKRLREHPNGRFEHYEAADRIEALVKERDERIEARDMVRRLWVKEKTRAEAAEALIADCADYLKEGETPRQRMDRDHKDVLALMDMLAKEKTKREAAEAALEEAYFAGWADGSDTTSVTGDPTPDWEKFKKGASRDR